MSRYIDADALLKGHEDHELISTHLIWNAPTADVVEVKHGRWIKSKAGGVLCSECYSYAPDVEKGSFTTRRIEQEKSAYCPNCGARMDGGKMSDYIKREDAIKTVVDHSPLNPKEAEYMFSGCKSADVVEVVRCKNCKHHEELLYNNDGKVLCWVHDLDVVVDGNGYCNYGERKEQEHESGME